MVKDVPEGATAVGVPARIIIKDSESVQRMAQICKKHVKNGYNKGLKKDKKFGDTLYLSPKDIKRKLGK